MRIILLSTFWTIALDILAWLLIHMAVVMLMVRIPRERFDPGGVLYRVRSWEDRGRTYERIFRIKSWKSLLPDGATWMQGRGFPKRELASRDASYMEAFLIETCRAELTHWTIVLFAPFFFLWNKPLVGWIMIGYALAENLPLIMAQRYNRARLAEVCRKARGRKGPRCPFP